MTTPIVYPRVIAHLQKLMDEFKLNDTKLSAGVGSVGDASDYAEVWEWGNVRQDKKGPKTVQGINPDGEEVWLSIQAPSGYIKIHESQYWDIYEEEVNKIEFSSTTKAGIKREIEAALRRTVMRCAVLVANTAPVDTSKLAGSIEAINPGDSLLEESEDNERVLIL